MSARILTGDVRVVLPTLPSDSVQCVVTSPPYWNLRSYLPNDHPNKHFEIGSEPSLQEWVDTMVEVFREVRRVLRPDGTLFLNLGDAYAGSGRGGDSGMGTTHGPQSNKSMTVSRRRDDHPIPRTDLRVAGLKPKDMMGQPWRVAFALQADGWWLRQEIIWHKPNPMPESIRDRCTKAHEHVFLLTKSERYWWGFEAVQEMAVGLTDHDLTGRTKQRVAQKMPDGWDTGPGAHGTVHRQGREKGRYSFARETKHSPGEHGQSPQHRPDREDIAYGGVRNPRSVWTIPTQGFNGAHFATFPPELAKRCIVAGSRDGDTVLDPFGGSGTTGLVADGLGRRAILIDLDERNAPMASERIRGDSPLFAEVES